MNNRLEKFRISKSPKVSAVVITLVRNAKDKSHCSLFSSLVIPLVWEHFSLSESDPKKAICKHCPRYKNKFAHSNGGTEY